eukprot:TRINITY_DN13642_c0_g1_i1.p1 TRINITY_DN13642_c0_g1~~TRINITY_DN13642_c0_g1_i1.p1  ORF type:complete len:145 (-),score=26.72 TRINITY_DN13642_c0_g1_i1:547-981(-)
MDMFQFMRHFVCCSGRDKAEAPPTAVEARGSDADFPSGLTCTTSSHETKFDQGPMEEEAASTEGPSSRRSSLGTSEDEDTDEDMPALIPAPSLELTPSLKPAAPPKPNAKLALFKQSVSARARGAPATASAVHSRLAAMQAARR